jgi:hypothetical protein
MPHFIVTDCKTDYLLPPLDSAPGELGQKSAGAIVS